MSSPLSLRARLLNEGGENCISKSSKAFFFPLSVFQNILIKSLGTSGYDLEGSSGL